MKYMDWCTAVELVLPHIVQISTPGCSGTGFLVSVSEGGQVCGIATAAHVVQHADMWELPIRLDHKSTGKSVLLRPDDRAIFLQEDRDIASIVFNLDKLPLPRVPLPLAPEGRILTVGNEIGWVGFPGLVSTQACFFSGHVSSHYGEENDYLVDGVAINGVSGGPAFWNGDERVTVLGVLSAYIVNRATGEALPGLSLVRSAEPFHVTVKAFKSLDEAKEKENQKGNPDASGGSPPTDSPP